MFIEDLALHPVVRLKAIGYLDGDFVVGNVPADFLDKLKKLNIETMPSFGHHDCPYCGGAKSSSEIMAGGYIWPEMLTHYVRVHKYQPPQEFVDFVTSQTSAKQKKKKDRMIKLPDFDF
ncbi:MAG: hypothetical protein HY225_03290 [Candidatus Vogelbacteria bacterium]|nr:hypothetical protein [Candidatus Vogelbacteria bacterium]